MTPGEIELLAAAARRAGLQAVELSGPGLSLRLRLDQASNPEVMPVPAPAAPSVSNPRGVRATGVGLFRHRHPLSGRPYSDAGQHVEAGQVVGFLDTGAALKPLTAPVSGVIGPPACEDGTLVGYGTLLYPLE